MFGLPIVLAALATMGAPALPVACNPAVSDRGASASTYFVPGTTTPLRIEFGVQVCAGLVWLSASAPERATILRLNPAWPVERLDRAAGVALVVVLHESRHATGDRVEASAQCHAMKELPAFAQRFAPPSELPVIMANARLYDASLPPAYHEASC